MKPENILIDKDGFAVLTDFGLSKDNFASNSQATSFCGTTEYLAPEIIEKKSYGKACDWWSFGCVVYEMLTGIPPFYDKNKQAIYAKIRYKNPNFYEFHSPQAIDLISRLLDKDPARRLGTVRGAQEIKEHPFFSCIDWEIMLNKSVIPPYTPILDSKMDLKHFDADITNIPIESPPLQHSEENVSCF